MEYRFLDKHYSIKRYPSNSNNSLKPWNAGDELTLIYLEDLLDQNSKIIIANDDFGFLATTLNTYTPISIVNNKTQEYALKANSKINNFELLSSQLVSPLEHLNTKHNLGLLKVPKSIDLFELYLAQIHQNLTDDGRIICSFMTKYFTPQLLKVASKYFEDIQQTKAHKKARLIVLQKKKTKQLIPLHHLNYKGNELQQYYGVFSASNIDYASQFLIDHLIIQKNEEKILDLASGNGILGLMALQQQPHAAVTLLDDSFLAIASSQLNLQAYNCSYIHDNTLATIADSSFDLVISNPPFHFGYEINISVPLGMFSQVAQVLKPNGRFIMVANNHLKYLPHLKHKFSTVKVLQENKRFKIYECLK
ncbi:MAG: methyltransferase [Flavobacteriales bacterium]|jgi:16S rRNA G1207 methylase RsmC|nr:methyltransferase [Flavobacteriales bacterium]